MSLEENMDMEATETPPKIGVGMVDIAEEVVTGTKTMGETKGSKIEGMVLVDKKEVLTEDTMTGTSTEGTMTATTLGMMKTVTTEKVEEQAIEVHLQGQK